MMVWKGFATTSASWKCRPMAHCSLRVDIVRLASKRVVSTSFSSSSVKTTSKISESERCTGVRLYRVLLRQCQYLSRELRRKGQSRFLVQLPLDPHEAGSASIFAPGRKNMNHDASPDAARVFELFYAWNEWTDREQLFLDEWRRQLDPEDDNTDSSSSFDFEDNDNEEESIIIKKDLWTSIPALQDAIRKAFRHDFAQDTLIPLDETLWIKYQHAWAIEAHKILLEQRCIFQLSSTSLQHNVQITAVSKCIGRTLSRHPKKVSSATTTEVKYRFAYRIRIQNVSSTETMQLLGRAWHIQEYVTKEEESGGVAVTTPTPIGEPIRVFAPQTGAVGQLPVLQPGQAFEYTSGTELGASGLMQGCFYLARVAPDTPSALVGMHVEAFDAKDRTFEVTVQPFALRADAGTGQFFLG
jgi:uncharacterized protein affecting Mg2+/Co2+ transport